MSSAAYIPATFSFGVLFTLLVLLAASGWMFFMLVQQWTTNRPLQTLREWAGDRKFKLLIANGSSGNVPIPLPPSLAGLTGVEPQIESIFTRGPVQLIRLSTIGKPAAVRPVWHLLIRETTEAQNPAGLRPAQAVNSFLDVLALTGFPALLPGDRFVPFATDSQDARAMAASPARGLLPADIGFLIHGPYITLDFSSRPFDVIEFDRLLTVMDQITGVG